MASPARVETSVGSFALPNEVEARLQEFSQGLMATGAVRAIVVYGGVARGRFVPGRSDVDVLVLLKHDDPNSLASIASTLSAWSASGERAAIEPMFLADREFDRVALLFPVKFRDIVERHVVVAGDPQALAGRMVPLTNARLRIEQELWNLAIRTRRRVLEAWNDEARLGSVLASMTRPLAIELASLLRLDGGERFEDDRTATIFTAAAERYGLDASALAALSAQRQGQSLSTAASTLAPRVLESIERAAQRAAGVA
jgi:predicted nucleotidyltransferase